MKRTGFAGYSCAPSAEEKHVTTKAVAACRMFTVETLLFG
jgi:hypothetical protein